MNNHMNGLTIQHSTQMIGKNEKSRIQMVPEKK